MAGSRRLSVCAIASYATCVHASPSDTLWSRFEPGHRRTSFGAGCQTECLRASSGL